MNLASCILAKKNGESFLRHFTGILTIYEEQLLIKNSGILLYQRVPVEQSFGFLLWSGNPFPLLLLLLVKQEFPVEGGDGGVRHWGEGRLHNAPHLRRRGGGPDGGA